MRRRSRTHAAGCRVGTERSIPSDAALVINVSTLLAEALGSTRSYVLEGAEFRFDEGRTPADGELQLTRTDGSILVAGQIRVAVEEACGRCLDLFQQPLQVQFREEFWPDYDPLFQRQVEIPEGREGFPIQRGLLDLQEALRQYVEMARPMQPICRPDCAGAGAGPGPSEAAGSPVDDRWAALNALRRDSH